MTKKRTQKPGADDTSLKECFDRWGQRDVIALRDKTRQDMTRQKQDKTKTRQDKTRQGKARQNKKQDKRQMQS